MTNPEKNDGLTIAAIATMAALMVTFVHEGLGHGGACLTLGGRITQLTSSLFHCDTPSPWIDPAGPVANLALGTLALILSRRVTSTPWRLFFILITAFSYFWEGGYLVQAMATAKGDLYFTGQNFIGEPSLWWRLAGGLLGVLLYLLAMRITSRALLNLWPQKAARHVARIAWCAATLATVAAALTYRGGIGQNLHDTIMEIGVASLPLLIIPLRALNPPVNAAVIERKPAALILATVIFIVFTLTQGHGLG